jgi:transporter family-2 protein
MQALLICLAVLMGIASAVQGATNGTLAGRIGLASAVWINALVVVAGATVFWCLAPRAPAPTSPSPWFLYLGGVYGLVIFAGAAFAFPRLGAGPTTALMVAAQLSMALALDHLGLPAGKIDVTPSRIVGAALLFAGAVLVLWPRLRAGGE